MLTRFIPIFIKKDMYTVILAQKITIFLLIHRFSIFNKICLLKRKPFHQNKPMFINEKHNFWSYVS